MDSKLRDFAAHLQLDCGLSFKTIDSYLSDLRDFGEKDLLQISKPQLQEHFTKLLGNGIQPRTIARKLSALRRFYEFAIQNQWTTQNPTLDFETPRYLKSLPVVLSQEEIYNIINEAANHGSSTANPTDALMIRLLYATGIRVSELVTLKPEDFDSSQGLLRILGKGQKQRWVPLDLQTQKQLISYLSDFRSTKHRSGNSLFISRQGRPFTRQGFWKLIKKHALKAGVIKKLSPHSFRHAFATHLLENGMNLRSLQMLLGHSDVSTTEIYSHISTEHLFETLKNHHPKAR